MAIKRDELAAKIFAHKAGNIAKTTKDMYAGLAQNAILAADVFIETLSATEKARNDAAIKKAQAKYPAQPAPKPKK